MNRLFTRIVSAATSAAAAVFLSLGGLNIFTGESGYDAAHSSIVLGVTSGDTKADISDPAELGILLSEAERIGATDA